MLMCMSNDDLLSTPMAAEQLGLSPATLRYWRHVQTGPPYIKLGKHVRYQRADLRAWVRSNRCQPAAGRPA